MGERLFFFLIGHDTGPWNDLLEMLLAARYSDDAVDDRRTQIESAGCQI